MDGIDGTEHYEGRSTEATPSLLTVILDTNPYAWAALSGTLPLPKAVAALLVFINAHLAFNYANKVAVVASHTHKAQWLYPTPSRPARHTKGRLDASNDTLMPDTVNESEPLSTRLRVNGPNPTKSARHDPTKYLPFQQIEVEVLSNLNKLIAETSPSILSQTTSTKLAGALTLALCYINRQTIIYNETHGTLSSDPSTGANLTRGGLQSRILLLSVSGSSDLASQYIPIMNTIFACQRLSIPIDVCKISNSTPFLQQASDATSGIFMALESPAGLLQYLFRAFLPDQLARQHLVLPTRVDVDFRAACFCHRRIVDIGFVCSICLSIFCESPPDAICLTCGTHLTLGDYGGKSAVVSRKKKKKRRALEGGSSVGTPVPGTPGPS